MFLSQNIHLLDAKLRLVISSTDNPEHPSTCEVEAQSRLFVFSLATKESHKLQSHNRSVADETRFRIDSDRKLGQQEDDLNPPTWSRA